jgi:hypothetical protein
MVQNVADHPCAITLGADRGYDAADFGALNARPHIVQNTSGRRSAIDKRTTRHPGYGKSRSALHTQISRTKRLSAMPFQNPVQAVKVLRQWVFC